MSENPTPNAQHLTLNALRLECHRLVDAVSRRPGAAKLLLAVHKQLTLFAAYKANRYTTDRPSARPP